ncbi:MAG TPA: N-acetylmuramoyl-L-alanine amidase [Terriglobales bacterium]|nr:N-acetylmuramoyl-L-alanine amidase [Terriglobales bacterium]
MDRKRRGVPAASLAALLLLAGLVPGPPARACGAAGAPPWPEAKKLRTVVIDPGHGGMELGAKGKLGHLEKDITLSVALKLKALIERNMAFRVVLTRDKDVDVPVESRAAVANNVKADLFISIHTNGSRQKAAEGSETFFLSSGPTPDEETRRLAYLENNGSRIEEHADRTSEGDVKMILWDMAQTAYIRQSSQLADLIQAELNALLGTRNRGIKQAPFKVLTGVACPAVLVEAAFISNPAEEKRLATDEFQASVAEAIYRGLSKYLQLYP